MPSSRRVWPRARTSAEPHPRPPAPRLDPAAELLRHGLHAVADAEHRHTRFESGARGFPGRLLVRRHVAAGEDDAAGAEAAHEIIGDVVGMDLAVDLGFPDAPRDQLRVLRSEIQDKNLLVRAHSTR